ncbi:phage tail assembly protein [Pseudomonas aeruginosa]|uniref:phage tail assembly protein n=1 Tax=Pseudomonas aeruginosa TaxID=287 RepID=UPI00383A43A0
MELKKQPEWLELTADAAVITLSRPSTVNSVSVDRITLRAPTVRDVRQVGRLGGDAEERELQLFASLAEVGVSDLESLRLVDYQRLQEGYFRLVQGDGV